ncbi:hypothetical protein C8J57DRAFT_1581528 [Mycena rebaudengoi]|nr:hypothetical protein C8J57DRAFT_1581528 [Mycena rebaudengoi]
MPELKKVIQLHSIRVTSLTNPHADLPGDMKMFAQLIVEDNIFLQALPVASEDNQMSWKLGFGCKILPHASTFSVTILRESETEGTRLLGYVEIGRGEVLESVESKKSFQLKCNKVNPDGPSLNFNAGFSVSELLYHKGSGLDLSVASTKVHKTRSELQKMHEDLRKPQFSMDVLQRWVMHEKILLCLQSNDDRARWLNVLGDILLQSYQASGNVDDLNQAVCAYKDAVRDDPGPISHLTDLGRSLRHRFKQFGSLVDINQSVVMREAAVERTLQGDLLEPSRLDELGMSLRIRFQRLGGLDDLNQSVLRFEAVGTLTPDGHPDKPSRLNNLGNSPLRRFERLGDLSDLNKSIMMFEDAVQLTPDGHPNKPAWLNNLGSSLLRRFERLGDLSDLNKWLPDKPARLNNLGSSLLGRFERLGDLSDLNKSIMMFEDAVRLTPDGHPDKPARLNNLGISLLRRFERLGDLSDLNKSIMMFEDAVRLTPDGHPNKPARLNNLGSSLLGRFERLGDLSDLNRSIMMKEDAVRLTPDGHPNEPATLNNLGNSLFRCFERLGDLSDLNRSIMMKEDAVRLTPDGHPDKPATLNNLGSSLFRRFERLGDLSDLNKSIMMFEDAVQLTPDGDPDKPARLNNIGSSLLGRFERLGDLSDLNKSIMMFEDAVRLTPDGHPDKPARLNSLGGSLLGRFERLGDLSDLNKSIMMKEDAVRLTPDGHPDKPGWLNNLGLTLSGRFEQLHDPQDSEKMLCHYTSAASSATGPASIQFDAAKRWVKHAHIHEPSSILHAYTTAIKLIPEMAWLGLSITDRHHLLSQAGQVVRDAASAAIAVHDYEKAVEWLDQGRSVIWGQLLNLRTPVDELRKSHPDLADTLLSLSTSLETAGTRSNAVTDGIEPQSLDSIVRQYHDLALERNEVLQQIRELPGFERFLLSKPISELSHAAKMGPVAILNISAYGCDALILMPGLGDEVIHISLSDFTIHEAQAFAKVLASIVGTPGRR